MKMKALAAVDVGKLGIIELDIPEPGEYDCLVRMEACAICNSTDRKLLMNEFFPGPFPAVLGHEVISTVIKTGKKVKNFKPGDRVFRQRLADSHVPGGRSRWGGFAEYGLITDEWAKQNKPYGPETIPHDQQRLLINVTPPQATAMVTLMETLDCSMNNCEIKTGDSVAIIGSGPVGQAFAMFAQLLGASTVFAFGRNPAHAQRFKKVAPLCNYVVVGEKHDEVEKILESGGFDKVIEAVGSNEALNGAIELAGKRGTVFVYGVTPDSSPYNKKTLELPNVKRVGAREGRVQKVLIDFIQKGAVKLDDWISHVLPLNKYNEAFKIIESKEGFKVVLVP